MSLTKLTTSMNNHAAMPDFAGLSATAMKALFDKAGVDIQTYINSVLTAELDALIAAKAPLDSPAIQNVASINRLSTAARLDLITTYLGSIKSFGIGAETNGTFFVYDNTAGKLRLSINASGNVGINKDSANFPLQVNVGTGDTAAVFESTDQYSIIGFYDPTGTGSASGYNVQLGCDGDDFYVRTGGSSITRRMTIDSTGLMSLVNKTIKILNTASATQSTSKTTGVTLTSHTGLITTNASTLTSNQTATFTLTNSNIDITDTVIVHFADGTVNYENYNVWITKIASGSCQITIKNIAGASLSEALKIRFTIIKSA